MTLLAVAEASPAARTAVRVAGAAEISPDLYHVTAASRAVRIADAVLEDGIAAGFGVATAEEGEARARAAAEVAAPAGITATRAASIEAGDCGGGWVELGPLLPGGEEAYRYLRNPAAPRRAAREREAQVDSSPGPASRGALLAPPEASSEGPPILFWLLFLAAVAFLYFWTMPPAPLDFEIIP